MTPLNRLAALLLVPALGLAASSARADADVSVSSTTQAGWTSNAGRNGAERASGYLEQSATLEGTVSGRTYTLRGSLEIGGTHYLSVPEESDRTLSGAVDITLAPGKGWRLRGGFALEHTREGALLDLAGVSLATLSPRTQTTTEIAATRQWGETALTVTLGHRADRPRASTFDDPGVPDQRLDPITNLFSASASLAHALSPALAATARAEARQVVVGAIDQALYGRRPARRLTLAPGLEIRTESGPHFALEVGVDTLFAHAPTEGAKLYPYASLDAHLPITESLALTASADAGLDLTDPADGLADHSLEARAGAEVALSSAMRLSGAVFGRQTRATLAPVTVAREAGARLALDVIFDRSIEVSATLDHIRTREGTLRYSETRIGLGISGRL